MWTWGYGREGQIGNGTVNGYSSPVQVGALTNWKAIKAGRASTGVPPNGTSCSMGAIKSDGTLWSWGRNIKGCLGLGDTVHRSSPTQVGSKTTWKNIAPHCDNLIASGFG